MEKVSEKEIEKIHNLDEETLKKYGLKLCPICEDAILKTIRRPKGLFGPWEYHCPNCGDNMLI